MTMLENNHKNKENRKEETVFSYNDGNVYMGEMVNGLRHGRGILRTPAFVYSSQTQAEYTSEYAVENAHLAKWHEYIGDWVNDKLHGRGVHLWKSGNGSEIILFHGNWVHGQPQRNRRPSESESESESVQDLETEESKVDLETANEREIFGY